MLAVLSGGGSGGARRGPSSAGGGGSRGGAAPSASRGTGDAAAAAGSKYWSFIFGGIGGGGGGQQSGGGGGGAASDDGESDLHRDEEIDPRKQRGSTDSNASTEPSSSAEARDRLCMADFELLQVLGRGGYGKVILARLAPAAHLRWGRSIDRPDASPQQLQQQEEGEEGEEEGRGAVPVVIPPRRLYAIKVIQKARMSALDRRNTALERDILIGNATGGLRDARTGAPLVPAAAPSLTTTGAAAAAPGPHAASAPGGLAADARRTAMPAYNSDVAVDVAAAGAAAAAALAATRKCAAPCNFLSRLRFAFQTAHKVYIGLDFFSGGDLHYHLRHGPPPRAFSEHRAAFYAAELCCALEHLHSRGIVYRDVKPENVMIDTDGHVCLVDFGLSRGGVDGNGGAKSIVGTPCYAAPELLLAAAPKKKKKKKKTTTKTAAAAAAAAAQKRPSASDGAAAIAEANRPRSEFEEQDGYGVSIDWWGLGILIHEMLTCRCPFVNKNHQALYWSIVNTPLVIKPTSPLSQPAREALYQLLQRDPAKRWGAAELKRSHFFAGADGRYAGMPGWVGGGHPQARHFAGAPPDKLDWAALEARRLPPPWVPTPVATDDDGAGGASGGGGGGSSSGGGGTGSGRGGAAAAPNVQVAGNVDKIFAVERVRDSVMRPDGSKVPESPPPPPADGSVVAAVKRAFGRPVNTGEAEGRTAEQRLEDEMSPEEREARHFENFTFMPPRPTQVLEVSAELLKKQGGGGGGAARQQQGGTPAGDEAPPAVGDDLNGPEDGMVDLR